MLHVRDIRPKNCIHTAVPEKDLSWRAKKRAEAITARALQGREEKKKVR